MSSLAQLKAEIPFLGHRGDPLGLLGKGPGHRGSLKYEPLAKKFHLGPDNHPAKNQTWLTKGNYFMAHLPHYKIKM